MYRIKTFNNIAPAGLERLDPAFYEVGSAVSGEEGILVRSANLLDYTFPDSLLAIARAGVGVNNIPLDRCSASGVAVFSTPGANANAVKELVICAMLISSRDVTGAVRWVHRASPPSRGLSCTASPWASSAWVPSAPWWPTWPWSWAWTFTAMTRSSP